MCLHRIQPVSNSTPGTRKLIFNQSSIKTDNLYRKLSLRKSDTHWHEERGRREESSKASQYTLNEKKEMVQGRDSVLE